jgi:hypothetical protein
MEEGSMSEELEDEDAVEEDWPVGIWLGFPGPPDEKGKETTIQRWFETEDAAREALVGAGVPPKAIREALKTPATPWLVIAEEDGEEPLVYPCEDMPAAIKLILTFCDEDSGIDGLEAMRTLEQAAADGLTEVSVGPYKALMQLEDE